MKNFSENLQVRVCTHVFEGDASSSAWMTNPNAFTADLIPTMLASPESACACPDAF